MNEKRKKQNRRDLRAAQKWAKSMSELAAGALSGIQGRSSLTADDRKRLAPTRLDKMEVRVLEMLVGWSITDIECLLVDRVVPEAKRRAKVPK